jgi:hypothetical protein
VRAPTVVVAMALALAGVLATPAAAVTANPAWSGYVFTGGTFTSISATWNEPAVYCNSYSDLLDIWVGLGGYTDSTVEQAGVAANCSSRSPVYEAFTESYPANPVYASNALSGGDAMMVTVSTTGDGYYLMTIIDRTKGWIRTVRGSGPTGGEPSAEVIVEPPTLSSPDFGSVTFTNITVNGRQVGSSAGIALQATDQTGPLDHTGALNPSGFTVTYLRE